MNDTELSPIMVRDLVLRLHDLASTATRVLIDSHRWGSPYTYTGYPRVNGDLIKAANAGVTIDPDTYVTVHFRKTQWGSYEGWQYVRLKEIHVIRSTTKHRRTGQYQVLWRPNPFALTAEGDLDMASSLKGLLGIA